MLILGIVAYCIVGLIFTIWFYTKYENLSLKMLFPIICLGCLVGVPLTIVYLIEKIFVWINDMLNKHIDWNKIIIKKRS